MSGFRVPAITPELDFISRHIDDANDIYYGAVVVDPKVKELSDRVYDRAFEVVKGLLEELRQEISGGVTGIIRANEWHNQWNDWGCWSPIYVAKGPKKKLGVTGLHLECKPHLRAVAYVSPKGGLDGRKELTSACHKITQEVQLVSEHKKEYPYWNDCVIWFNRALTPKTSREEMASELSKQAKEFYKVARPHLRRLA